MGGYVAGVSQEMFYRWVGFIKYGNPNWEDEYIIKGKCTLMVMNEAAPRRVPK